VKAPFSNIVFRGQHVGRNLNKQNPKSEYRNPKQIWEIAASQNPKQTGLEFPAFFFHLNLFLVSKFELGISILARWIIG
jgi:hypothetical protein